MSQDDNERAKQKQAEEILKYATTVRQFEIGLFWQRSIFFWGFIGAAFVAYAALGKDNDAEFRVAVACFGLVCSAAWTLVNRGRKYWQQAWEQKVERIETVVLGEKLFGRFEQVTPQNLWLRARCYSVSKLTIALSDFAVIVWLVLCVKALPAVRWSEWFRVSVLMPAGAVLYILAMLIFCRSDKRNLTGES